MPDYVRLTISNETLIRSRDPPQLTARLPSKHSDGLFKSSPPRKMFMQAKRRVMGRPGSAGAGICVAAPRSCKARALQCRTRRGWHSFSIANSVYRAVLLAVHVLCIYLFFMFIYFLLLYFCFFFIFFFFTQRGTDFSLPGWKVECRKEFVKVAGDTDAQPCYSCHPLLMEVCAAQLEVQKCNFGFKSFLIMF